MLMMGRCRADDKCRCLSAFVDDDQVEEEDEALLNAFKIKRDPGGT